ncbi:hypothetical protein GCM10010433_39170 [Streptomyces pulveraceus]
MGSGAGPDAWASSRIGAHRAAPEHRQQYDIVGERGLRIQDLRPVAVRQLAHTADGLALRGLRPPMG